MRRVALLVTGKTEEVLHHSLKQIFPAAEFVMLPRREGFTSSPLPATPITGTAGKPTNAERLAAALVAEVEPGREDARSRTSQCSSMISSSSTRRTPSARSSTSGPR